MALNALYGGFWGWVGNYTADSKTARFRGLQAERRHKMKAHIETKEEKNIKALKKEIARMLKVACVVLAEDFDFGKQRLCKFLNGMSEKSDWLLENPEQWIKVDDYLIEKMKLDGEFLREDLEEREVSANYNRKMARNKRW